MYLLSWLVVIPVLFMHHTSHRVDHDIHGIIHIIICSLYFCTSCGSSCSYGVIVWLCCSFCFRCSIFNREGSPIFFFCISLDIHYTQYSFELCKHYLVDWSSLIIFHERRRIYVFSFNSCIFITFLNHRYFFSTFRVQCFNN